jgi:hypothetical protein
MADLQQKYDLDLRFGGSTLGDFGYFYDVELPYIYKCLNSLRKNQVSPAGESVEPAPNQVKIEDGRIYVRDEENQGWIFLFDQAYGGGLRNEGETLLKDTDAADGDSPAADRAGKIVLYDSEGHLPNALMTSDLATDEVKAGKIAVYNENGVLPANISGSANKLAGKTVDLGSVQDGQVIAYNVATNTWIPTDRFAGVGQGKTLGLVDYKGVIGTYNGGAVTMVDTPLGTLLPDVTYAVGEVARTNQLPSDVMLVCVSAGTTPSEIPSLTEVEP